MNHNMLPLAALDDFLPLLVMLFFLIVGGINQLLTRNRQARPPARPQRAPRGGVPPVAPIPGQARRQPPPGQARPAQPPEGQLAGEIDEFLRRAGQRRSDAARPVRPPPPPLVIAEVAEASDEGPTSRPLAERHLRHLKSGLSRQRQEEQEKAPASSEALPATPPAPLQSAFGSSDLTSDLVARQHESAGPNARVQSAAASGSLAALLASPVGLRQAILLREILERPTDRWE